MSTEVGHCENCCARIDQGLMCNPKDPFIKHLPKEQCPYCSHEVTELQIPFQAEALHIHQYKDEYARRLLRYAVLFSLSSMVFSGMVVWYLLLIIILN